MVMDINCSVELSVAEPASLHESEFKANRDLSLELAHLLANLNDDRSSDEKKNNPLLHECRMIQSFSTEKYWLYARYPGPDRAKQAGRVLSMRHPTLCIRLHLSGSDVNVEQRLFFESGELVATQKIVKVWGPLEVVKPRAE
jgi:hypothetical protein